MNGITRIKYLTHPQIDKTKWDHCIDNAGNGLIYGYSFYLDAMAGNWDALILNDYEAILPLTWKKKYGIHYLYQPFLTAQLGVFGNNITGELVETFLKAIPAKYKYWDIYLNHQHVYPLANFNIYQRSNYVLDLNKPYEELYAAYRENSKRNIRKAQQLGCSLHKDFAVERVIELAWQQMHHHTKEAAANAEKFKLLYKQLHTQQKAVTYGIVSAREELLASCVFFFSHHRAYYILVGNHPDGKTTGASHALIDGFIKEYAGKNLLLDFEGSDLSNLAFFYSSFGAVEEKYTGIQLNRLPFYLKWMKK